MVHVEAAMSLLHYFRSRGRLTLEMSRCAARSQFRETMSLLLRS